jgi:competence protein ComEA
MQIARVESARAARRLVPRAATRARGATERSTSPRSRDQAHTKKPDVSRPIDLDVASAKEIERLPYIGEALAIRITSDRDSCGSFGSLDGLKRVYGIGDGMARRLAPLVTFSGPSRPMGAAWPPGCARADKSAALRRRGRS